MRYAISFLLGFCLSGLWVGFHPLLRPKLEPFAHGALEPFSPLLSAALPTVLVCIAAKTHPFHFSALADGRLWLITFVTVLLTCLVKRVFYPQQPVPTSGLAARCLEAACMEFPQRAMVQTFLCWYLTRRGGDEAMWASAPTTKYADAYEFAVDFRYPRAFRRAEQSPAPTKSYVKSYCFADFERKLGFPHQLPSKNKKRIT